MPTQRNFNNSFVHGAAAYSAYALGPFVHSSASLVVACLCCVYAGWCRQAYLAAFLGGIIVAVVGWTVAGILGAPGAAMAVIFMVPYALLLMLPVALAGYVIGKGLRALAQRRAGPADAKD